MLIFGFDSGTVNLGVCCVEYNENWQNDIIDLLEESMETIEEGRNNNVELYISKQKALYVKLSSFINNIIKIKWMNNINLNIGSKDIILMSSRLKYFLESLDTIGKPNLVLIEFQMVQNNTTNCMSSQIAYHYSYADNNIKYRLPNYSLPNNKIDNKVIDVQFIIPKIKNIYHLAPDGAYYNFIAKYKTNKSANKNHTQYNFEYFVTNYSISYDKKIKLNDISDAFMMIFGYLRLKNILI
jgi:hypothetical protein